MTRQPPPHPPELPSKGWMVAGDRDTRFFLQDWGGVEQAH